MEEEAVAALRSFMAASHHGALHSVCHRQSFRPSPKLVVRPPPRYSASLRERLAKERMVVRGSKRASG